MLLAAEAVYERRHEMRVFFVPVLAVIGGVVWLELIWPASLPEYARVAIPAPWRAGCVVALVAVVLEWTWYRRLVRRLSEYQAPQRENLDDARSQFAQGGSDEKDRSHH
jgi:hypothetical protein